MWRLSIIISLIIFLYISLSYALTGTEGVGNPILDLGVGARPTGMGGAFVAVCNDGNAGYWNPAGLSQLTKFEIHSMYTSLFLGTKFFYLGFSFPIIRLSELKPKTAETSKQSKNTNQQNNTESGTAGTNHFSLSKEEWNDLTLNKYGGLSLIWVESFISGLKHTEEIIDPVTGQPYTRYEDFTARDDAYILAYGIGITEYLATGFNIKITSRHIKDAKGFSVGTDFGILARIVKTFKIGFLIQDVGDTKMRWEYTEMGIKKESAELIISRLKLGASYDFVYLFDDKFTKGLILSVEMRWQKDFENPPPVYYYTGVEWNIYNMVYLRIGFDEQNLTAGIGIVWKIVYCDYAYVTHPDLDNTHRISLAAKF